jgi:hypothetical protein
MENIFHMVFNRKQKSRVKVRVTPPGLLLLLQLFAVLMA